MTLVDESRRGQGGRNQQLALAALEWLGDCEGIALLSGGTDGEDGPTDAAGAFVTDDVVRTAQRAGARTAQSTCRATTPTTSSSNAAACSSPAPTQTNVCDLRWWSPIAKRPTSIPPPLIGAAS